jgi:5,10-methylenetetrahydrofolate reductase
MLLSEPDRFVNIAEVNPPPLPSIEHLRLKDRWRDVLVTDNPFRQVRVSPYAYAARITHDIPTVTPTVVCSTRDRNILAIESEVRGAIGNGVRSFLVVHGDVLPEVEHWSDSYEIVEFLRELQRKTVPFEVGMALRARRWQMERRMRLGAQYFVTGPVVDPDSVSLVHQRLSLGPADPPVYLSIMPPFSDRWIRRITRLGAHPVGNNLAEAVRDPSWTRHQAWQVARDVRRLAAGAGFAGTVLMGCRFETLVDEAFREWSGSPEANAQSGGDRPAVGRVGSARALKPPASRRTPRRVSRLGHPTKGREEPWA